MSQVWRKALPSAPTFFSPPCICIFCIETPFFVLFHLWTFQLFWFERFDIWYFEVSRFVIFLGFWFYQQQWQCQRTTTFWEKKTLRVTQIEISHNRYWSQDFHASDWNDCHRLWQSFQSLACKSWLQYLLWPIWNFLTKPELDFSNR